MLAWKESTVLQETSQLVSCASVLNRAQTWEQSLCTCVLSYSVLRRTKRNASSRFEQLLGRSHCRLQHSWAKRARSGGIYLPVGACVLA